MMKQNSIKGMRTKTCLNAFTLAEVMVVLFVMAIILAAFAPMMTTRTKVNKTSPWTYASPDSANAYFGANANQRAMIGQKTKGSDINNRLTINTSAATQAGMLFKQAGTAIGQLSVNSNSTTILGALPSSLNSSTGTTALGVAALPSASTGNYNTAVGNSVLPNLTTGAGNTAVGAGAFAAVSSSTYNGSYGTGVGYRACEGITTSNTTCIGAFAGPRSTDTTANNLYLGNDNTTVYIGSTTLSSFVTTVSSDKRLKNIKGENVSGLDKILKIKTYDFTFKNEEKPISHVGVIAQDLKKIFPDAVSKGSDGYLKIRQEDMFYAMINSIKELAFRDDAKNQKIKALEKKNAELEARLEKLEKKLK